MDTSDLGNSIMTVRYKLVFVGDVGVGKTSIMNRFITDQFSEEYDSTIGVDFATKTIEYKENSLKLQMWDSAGLERYRALIPSYVRGASIIFIIYDISSKESFNNLNTWINFIKQVNTDNSMIVLCGNKTDLERKVTTKEGQILANKEKMLFFEVSAKNGENVTKMMYSCIAELPFFEQFKEGDKDESPVNTDEMTQDSNKTPVSSVEPESKPLITPREISRY